MRACSELALDDNFVFEADGEVTPAGEWVANPTYICSAQIEQLSLFDYALKAYRDSHSDDFWNIAVETAAEVFFRAFIEPRDFSAVIQWEHISRSLDDDRLTSRDIDLLRDLAQAEFYDGERELFFNLAFGSQADRDMARPRLRQLIVQRFRDQDNEVQRNYLELAPMPGRTSTFWWFLARVLGPEYISEVTRAVQFDPGVAQEDISANWFYFVEERTTLDYLHYLPAENITPEDRTIFEEIYGQLITLFHSYPRSSQEALYLEMLLGRAIESGSKFDFSRELLLAMFWGESFYTAPLTAQNTRQLSMEELFSTISLGDEIISLAPANLPWEIQQALDQGSYYEFVVGNVDQITFYANSASLVQSPAAQISHDVGGFTASFNRAVNLSLFDADWRERSLAEIVGILVHEASHVWFDKARGDNRLLGERQAFANQLDFLEIYLRAGLDNGSLLPDSEETSAVAFDLVGCRRAIEAADNELRENSRSEGYPTILAVDNIAFVNRGAIAALGFDAGQANLLSGLFARMLRPGTVITGSFLNEALDRDVFFSSELVLTLLAEDGSETLLSTEEALLFEQFIVRLILARGDFSIVSRATSVNLPGMEYLKEMCVMDGLTWVDEGADLYAEAFAQGSDLRGMRMREYFRLSVDQLRSGFHWLNLTYEVDQYLINL